MRDYHKWYKTIRQIPKAELHLHLDGSIEPEFMVHLSKEVEHMGEGVILPPELQDVGRLRAKLSAANANTLLEYLDCFFYPLWITQTYDLLRDSVINIGQQLKKDNVTYFELRFAPTLHMRRGLGVADTVNAVCEGLAMVGDMFDDITGRAIVIAMRQEGPKVATHMLDEVFSHRTQLMDKFVVGFDAAGYEAISPKLFHEAFSMARGCGMKATFHIGENCPAYMIGEAVEALEPDRLGHCYRAVDDKGIMRLLRDYGAPIELCPSSSFHTGSVKYKHAFPLRYMLDFGIPVTINSDNLTISNTNLTNELCMISDFVADFEMLNIIRGGFVHAFDYRGEIPNEAQPGNKVSMPREE